MSQAGPDREETRLVRDALAALGVRRLSLAIHDASFPSLPDEEVGRGSPYSDGARGFLDFACALGFDAIQLGPQGQTSLVNPSPYDGSIFGKNVLALAVAPLVRLWPDLLPAVEKTAALVGNAGVGRADYDNAWQVTAALLDAITTAYLAGRPGHRELGALLADLRARAGEGESWLARASAFEVLARRHGHDDWRRWPRSDQALYAVDPGPGVSAAARALRAADEWAVLRHEIGQTLLADQQRELRDHAARLGLRLFGDLQAGMAHRDEFCWRHLLWDEYLMGAPPSRTNPQGQPWGYPVIRPEALWNDGDPGPGARLIETRVDQLLVDFDGLRIDHPHALVYPWVYRAADPDPYRAVRSGARLWASPDLADHPALARWSIVAPDQLDRSRPRYDDDWVSRLEDADTARFGRTLALVLSRARAHGRDADDIACEVLSTWPRPLRAVMLRNALGRFVVTQKTNPDDPADPYRSEGTAERDWIMIGSHDSEPLFRLLPRWQDSGFLARRAAYLAERLEPRAAARADFTARLTADPGHFADAMFAELFAAPAGNVSIFFPDLLGMTEVYNRVGLIHPDNWTLRVPRDYRAQYGEKRAQGRAASLPRALSLALRARFPGETAAPMQALADRLSALGARRG